MAGREGIDFELFLSVVGAVNDRAQSFGFGLDDKAFAVKDRASA
jgi:hypothetical protein